MKKLTPFLLPLLLLQFIFRTGYSQKRIIKSSHGDQIEVYTHDGDIVFQNKSVYSLTVELWQEGRLLKSYLLAPYVVFGDQNQFFQRHFPHSKKLFNSKKISKNIEETYFRVTYSEEAYNNDLKIIQREKGRIEVLDVLIPARNAMLRTSGYGDQLFYSNLFSIAFSNQPYEEKRKKMLQAFTKKALVNDVDNKFFKIVVAGILDIGSRQLSSESEKQKILSYTRICTERFFRNNPKDYPIKDFNFKFYPRHTISLNISHPINSDLRFLKGKSFGDEPANSLTPLFSTSHQAISIDLLGSYLHELNSFNRHISFVYGAFFERGEVFYENPSTMQFSENVGFTHQRIGGQIGGGLRLLGNNSLSGLEVQALWGIARVSEAEVVLDDINNPQIISREKYGNPFNSFLWKLRVKTDLKYIILAANLKYETDRERENRGERFELLNYNLSVGIPLYRLLKVK